MPYVAIVFGALLVALGLDGYLNLVGLIQPDKLHSPTSLIPAGLGAVLIVCGVIALKESLLKHAMHAAAALGMLGLLAGAGMGLPKLPALLNGSAERPAAIRLQLGMAVLCLAFVALCVKSFIDARRRRKLAEGASLKVDKS